MADQTPTPEPSRPNSAVLWDIVKTFSDEAQQAAKKRATSEGFSLDRGNIPFEETLINLSRNRDILVKSIENAALPQLPLKIQNQLVAQARIVATHLSALIAGTDSVLPFESAVDDLTATIWYSNLQNMSGEILGFHEKLNQLKSLEKALRELSQRSDSFKRTESQVNDVLSRINDAENTINNIVSSAADMIEDASKRVDLVKQNEHDSAASLASVLQSERSIAESASTSRAASGEVESIRLRANTSISELDQVRAAYADLKLSFEAFDSKAKAEIATLSKDQTESFGALKIRAESAIASIREELSDSNRVLTELLTTKVESATTALTASITDLDTALRTGEVKRNQASAAQLESSRTEFESASAKLLQANSEALEAVEQKSTKIVADNEKRTRDMFEELEKLEGAIREKILLATNYQLFHAFQTRQLAVAEGKDFWRKALFTCVGASFLLSIAFIIYLFFVKTYNAAFYLKLSISLPIIYAIHFCSTQYARERQLEEEYAFKSNISVSLESFRELVEKLIDKTNPIEAAKYSDFVIASVNKVFESSTQKILDGEDRSLSAPISIGDASSAINKVVGSVNDLLSTVVKLKQ